LVSLFNNLRRLLIATLFFFYLSFSFSFFFLVFFCLSVSSCRRWGVIDVADESMS